MLGDQREEGVQREGLLALYRSTRQRTEALAAPLSAEDQLIQSMPEASPTKWHRAHTTWFFEEFILRALGVDPVDPRYAYIFNSYYEAVGARHARPKRGVLSRPSAVEVGDYRQRVDDRIEHWIRTSSDDAFAPLRPMLELGVAHEEQHQELLLTDILHAFSESPIKAAYSASSAHEETRAPAPIRFVERDGGLREIGARGATHFSFDNERPRHKRWFEPFALADRLVTIRELKAFIDEGGYNTPSLWLSDGFDFVQKHGVEAPLYTTYVDGRVEIFSLNGSRVAHDAEPVVHVSYYEADAMARFLGARLPTEAEWEVFAEGRDVSGNFAESGHYRAMPACTFAGETRDQLFGDAWEWTQSGYEPYPGYRPPSGAVGEYNGKFMVNQIVLRGGSCLTPARHMRASYRNFWLPETRFQMTGIRLARGGAPR